MNDQVVVDKMIDFIEKKERDLQAKKMSADNSAKNDVVKSILDELERVIEDENN